MLTKSKLQYLKSLSQKKHREKEGVFLVEGWKGVEEAYDALKEIEILIYTKEGKGNRQFEPVLLSAGKKSKEEFETSQKEFALIADTVAAQGVAAVVKKFSFNINN